MRILHIAAGVHKMGGGTSEVVPRLCRALKTAGNEVRLVVIKTDDISQTAQDALEAGVEIVSFPKLMKIDPLAISPSMRKGLAEQVSWADIVHIHGLWQAPIWYGAQECLRQNKAYLMMPHGFLEPERLKKSMWKKRIIGMLYDRRFLRHANALVATSESEGEGFRRYGLSNSIHIMPIGLDLEKFNLKDQRKDGIRKKRLLYFSRITPIKGLDMLAEAWKRLQSTHPEWELVIAGPDDRGYTQELQRYMTSLGLSYLDASSNVDRHLSPSPLSAPSDILFTGPVYGDDKYAMLRSADAFVLPTRSENWSIAVAEAMATGLPVVCSKGAPWSCINECGCGRWVDISVDAIHSALEDVMSASDAKCREMGERGRQWIKDHLEWAKISRNLVKCYENIQGKGC